MLALFANNLLPVFLAAGAGYVLAWRFRLDARPLSQVAFYVFAPCLVLRVIVDSRLPLDALARMAGFAVVTLVVLAGLTALAVRALGWSRSAVAATVLVVLLPNAGNFGLSTNQFAFGEPGLAQASIFFVTSAILTFTLGVFVASMGRTSVAGALAGLARVPAFWAVPLAALLVATGTRLPVPLERTLDLLSQATIPLFLVLLGMQLERRGVGGPAGPLALATAVRLLGGVAVGLPLAWLFGLEGAARQAGLLQAAMPSAVITIVLATEYDVEPAFVTSVVVATTLLSPLTLTPLMFYLGASSG